jgi:pilus assembly protein CpaF
MKISEEAIRGQIASAVNFIVQATRLSDGSRKVISIAEITGMEGSVVQLQEIFKFERTGTSPEGKVLGHFAATGLRPKFMDEMERKGVFMPAGLFDPSSKF